MDENKLKKYKYQTMRLISYNDLGDNSFPSKINY